MPYAQCGDFKLFYEEKGHGEPILLIHDLVEDHYFWEQVQEQLAKNFRVISFDLRGVGQSSALTQAIKIEDLAQDVIALADFLELGEFHLVGNSFGGAIAQIVAKKNPKRLKKLILANSFCHLSKVVHWSLEMTLDIFKENPRYEFLYRMMMPWYFSSRFLEREEDTQKILEELKKRKNPLSPKSLEALINMAKDFDSTRLIKQIKAKTLVIIAEEDIFCLFRDSRQMVKALSEHQVELIGGGHASKIEHPNRFIEVIRDFCLAD